MTLLPSASVYLTALPYMRHLLLLIIIGMTSRLGVRNKLVIKRSVYEYVFLFIFANILSLLFVRQFISSDGYFIQFLGICCFVVLPLDFQSKIYYIFVKFGAFLIFFGLIEYIAYVFFGKSFLLAANIDRGEEASQVYDHGIFNIFTFDIIMRFQGLFREPGFLGICAGLLAFNFHNNNKLYMLIWIIGGIMALSLTFYVMLALAIIYYLLYKKTSFKVKALTFSLLAFLAIALVNIEVLDYAILNRISLYSSGEDNRTTGSLNGELGKMFDSVDCLYGYGYQRFVNRDYTWGNSGLKAELYKHGIIITIIFIIGFTVLLLSYPAKSKEKIFVFILYLIAFYCVDCKYAIHEYLILLSMLNPYVTKSITNNRSSVLGFDKKV